MADGNGVPVKTRVIGLGNTLLKDDGVGVYVAREVARRLPDGPDFDVVETECGGFALLELMTGQDRVVLVDSIAFDDLAPGTVVRIEPSDLRTSLRLRSVHEIDLPTALALGRAMGFPMPSQVVIVAVQGGEMSEFGEFLTPPVAAVLPDVVDRVLREVQGV